MLLGARDFSRVRPERPIQFSSICAAPLVSGISLLLAVQVECYNMISVHQSRRDSTKGQI